MCVRARLDTHTHITTTPVREYAPICTYMRVFTPCQGTHIAIYIHISHPNTLICKLLPYRSMIYGNVYPKVYSIYASANFRIQAYNVYISCNLTPYLMCVTLMPILLVPTYNHHLAAYNHAVKRFNNSALTTNITPLPQTNHSKHLGHEIQIYPIPLLDQLRIT